MKSNICSWENSNTVFYALLGLSGIAWVLQQHTFGITVGCVTLAIAYFLYKKERWAYFAAAVICFGLLRIAMDDGNDFYQGYQSYVKLPYVIAMVIAIVLHEKVAKLSNTPVDKPI